MTTPRKYPTGRAGLGAIISEVFLYVDKTKRMYEMIGDRKFVSLSSPRCFGKLKDYDMKSKVFTLSWSMPNLPQQFRN